MISGIGNGGFNSQAMEAMRQNRFKKTDADSDGKITKDELKAALPEDGKGPSVEDLFGKVDTNQDGAIDEAEDKAAMAAMEKNRPRQAPDASKLAAMLFQKADSDSDGKITKTELRSVLPENDQNASKVDALFKAADADEDGSITGKELEDALKKMVEEMKAKRAEHPHGIYNKDGAAQKTVAQDGFAATA